MSSDPRPEHAPADPGAEAAPEETAPPPTEPALPHAPGEEVRQAGRPSEEPGALEQPPRSTEPESPPEEAEPRLRLVAPVGDASDEGATHAARPGAPGVDPFGLDVGYEQRALVRLRPLYERWFRVETRGIERVPAVGRAILVANHAGALPWDIAMLKCAMAYDHASRRRIRPLVEDVLFHTPFVGVAANRFGAVRAHPQNAEALLAAEEAIAVFPEGEKGIAKPFRQRYRLQRFGRGGFVRLALRMNAPVIPVAILGSEDTQPLLGRLRRPLGLGLPFLPITPTFPLLGPAGLLPLPAKWRIVFLPPVTLAGDPDDELTVQRHTEDVRGAIQATLDGLLARRSNPFT